MYEDKVATTWCSSGTCEPFSFFKRKKGIDTSKVLVNRGMPTIVDKNLQLI